MERDRETDGNRLFAPFIAQNYFEGYHMVYKKSQRTCSSKIFLKAPSFYWAFLPIIAGKYLRNNFTYIPHSSSQKMKVHESSHMIWIIWNENHVNSCDLQTPERGDPHYLKRNREDRPSLRGQSGYKAVYRLAERPSHLQHLPVLSGGAHEGVHAVWSWSFLFYPYLISFWT